MLAITYAPDGTSNWANGLPLCATTRSLTELEVRFNHKREIGIDQLAQILGSAQAALAQDYGNWRNTLSLKIRRGVDLNAAAFVDPEAALAFALQHPASFPTTGTLRIVLVGAGGTNVTLYLLNCGVEAIAHNYNDLAIAPAFDYTFNGGLITTVSPF